MAGTSAENALQGVSNFVDSDVYSSEEEERLQREEELLKYGKSLPKPYIRYSTSEDSEGSGEESNTSSCGTRSPDADYETPGEEDASPQLIGGCGLRRKAPAVFGQEEVDQEPRFPLQASLMDQIAGHRDMHNLPGVHPFIPAVGVHPSIPAVGVHPSIPAVGVHPSIPAVRVQPFMPTEGVQTLTSPLDVETSMPPPNVQRQFTEPPQASSAFDTVPHPQNDLVSSEPQGPVEPQSDASSMAVLYRCRGKRIDELTLQVQQILRQREEERTAMLQQQSLHSGMVAEQQQQLGTLRAAVERLTTDNSVQGHDLQRKGEIIDQLCAEKRELQQSLQAAEVAVGSLRREVAVLGSGDALRRAREQYQATMAAAKEQHQAVLLELREELEQERASKQGSTGPTGDSPSRDCNGRAGGKSPAVLDEQGEAPASPLPSFLEAGGHVVGCKRCVELSTENEDLRCQASALEEETEGLQARVWTQEEQLQQQLLERNSLLSRLQDGEMERQELRTRLTNLDALLQKERECALKEKARSDELQSQSIRLHDESTARLCGAFDAEKAFIIECHQRDLHNLKLELADLKKKLSSTHPAPSPGTNQVTRKRSAKSVQTVPMATAFNGEEFDQCVRDAVEKAREEWRAGLEDSAHQSITAALGRAEENFGERLERERMITITRTRLECDSEMQRELRKQEERFHEDLKRREELWADRRGGKVEEDKDRVEAAVLAARQEWAGHQEAELSSLQSIHRQNLKDCAQQAAMKSKKHYEGVVRDVRRKMAADYQSRKDRLCQEWSKEKKSQEAATSALKLSMCSLKETLTRFEQERETLNGTIQEALRRDLRLWMHTVMDV